MTQQPPRKRQLSLTQAPDHLPGGRYDSHREAILRSDTHQAGADAVPTQASDSVNLYAFFSPSCYKGYSDNAKVGCEAMGVTSTSHSCVEGIDRIMGHRCSSTLLPAEQSHIMSSTNIQCVALF